MTWISDNILTSWNDDTSEWERMTEEGKPPSIKKLNGYLRTPGAFRLN